MTEQNGNGNRADAREIWTRAGLPVADFIRRVKDRLPRGGPSTVIIAFAVLVFVGLGAWTAYYTVPSDSVAVVQRFGKYLRDVPPGLHFKLPLGIDTATIVPVKRQLKQEFGFTIYGRMISERRQIAERFLSEGNGEAARIGGNRVRDLDKIQSEAYREVEEIRGLADAKATEIYASAYNQSAEAVEFYEFTRTMQAYKSIIAENTTLVLSTDSELFKFLRGMGPDHHVVPTP
jgi:regulator of protease activity HflC (stomatin/prohibitin superfamily)